MFNFIRWWPHWSLLIDASLGNWSKKLWSQSLPASTCDGTESQNWWLLGCSHRTWKHQSQASGQCCRFYLQFMHIWAPKTNVTFPPWENEKLVHHRWPLVSCQISLTIQQQKFELFHGERQCESMASCPKNATHNTTQTKERSLDLKSSVSHNLYSTLPCPTGYL